MYTYAYTLSYVHMYTYIYIYICISTYVYICYVYMPIVRLLNWVFKIHPFMRALEGSVGQVGRSIGARGEGVSPLSTGTSKYVCAWLYLFVLLWRHIIGNRKPQSKVFPPINRLSSMINILVVITPLLYLVILVCALTRLII